MVGELNFGIQTSYTPLKGSQMGPLPDLVSLCFGENVIFACKILSFLCSLDNFLLKTVIVFFFGNQISKWRSFEKRTIFDLYTFHTFFSHQGKDTKILQHISHLHTYTYFAHPTIDLFAFSNLQKLGIFQA